MVKFLVKLFFVLFPFTIASQIIQPYSVYLIGDAGEDTIPGKALMMLKEELLIHPNSAVIFLGDNVYPSGLIADNKTSVKHLESELQILNDYKGQVYFIPGNHDWWNHINLKKGKKRLLAEQKFIEDSLSNFTSLENHKEGTFLPQNGDPGPISKDFNGGKTRIIFVDTYRLIIEEGRKRHTDTLLLEAFYKELKTQLTDASNKHQKIIVVAHHPIHAKGKHSAKLVFLERLNRRFADSNTNYPSYNKMAIHLDSLLKEHNHPDIYYISGHEHSLEYFFNDSLHYLVSGAGSKVDQVKYKSVENAEEYLIWNEEGFFEIDFYGRKETVLMYHRKDDKSELQVHCVAGCN